MDTDTSLLALASDELMQQHSEDQPEEQEIQFRCKLCQYTGKEKDEIASHFLSEHIAVEIRSIGKGTDGGFVEIASLKKAAGKKKGRPKGSRKKSQEEAAEEDDDEDDDEDHVGKAFVHKPSQVSISSRGRRRKIPFKFSVDRDDDGSHPYLSRNSRRGKGSKRGRGGKNWRLLREDESFYQRLNLTVTPEEFEYQLVKLVELWEETWFLQKSFEDVKCRHLGCKNQLDEREMELHLQCHKPFLEGFQCPMCEFVCVHWRNMRHHYYKEHQEKGKTLACNQVGCDAVFERFGELKRHVSTTHLKTQLIETLTKPNTERKISDAAPKQNSSIATEESESTSETKDSSNPDQELKNVDKAKADENEPNEKMDNAAEEFVEIVMYGDLEFTDAKCELESTRKRITKKRRLQLDDNIDENTGEPKKKRHYVKSEEFHGNMADRQRALVAYTCDVCGGKYNDMNDMEKHRSFHYDVDEEEHSEVVKCTECNSKFTNAELLIEHIKQSHKRMLKLHRCHLCKFSSERRFDLKKHLLIHTGMKNFMCDQCGKCMSTPYNLKIHYLRLHAREEEKTISCMEEKCEFKCADKAVLKDHLRQKHNLMLDNKNLEKTEKIKLYTCKHCDYTGKKESSLRYHMRIHLENRQNKCKLCPYASKTKNNLILHMRTHDGMQPVKCPQCEFRGATNKIISEHILSKHAGIRPYRCLICKWSTSYSGNMWKHIHDHRKELGENMPEESVEVITGDGVTIPVPLRPPSGRKRSKSQSPQFHGSNAAENLKAISKELQVGQTTQSIGMEALSQLLQVNQAGPNSEETVTIVEVPLSLNDDESSIIMGGNENVTSSALNSLAAAVATAREVALLSQQAQAVMAGHQGADASNPYPVSQLFQQIAGQASGSQSQIISSALAPSTGNEVIIAVTSPDSLQQAVLQSGISTVSPLDSIGSRAGKTKVTYTIAQPQGGVGRVQFSVEPDHFENRAAVADIPDQEDHPLESDQVLVRISESALQITDEENLSEGQTLQIVEEEAVKVGDHPHGDHGGAVEAHGVQQLVTMMPEGELVMSMVQTNNVNPTVTCTRDGQQPVEAHIVVTDPENPGQYIQQEIHYVQTNESGEALLQQDGTTQVVHIVQQENGELAYQDSNGQVYSAQDAQVMFQSPDQASQGFMPSEITEAITISDVGLNMPPGEMEEAEVELGVEEEVGRDELGVKELSTQLGEEEGEAQLEGGMEVQMVEPEQLRVSEREGGGELEMQGQFEIGEDNGSRVEGEMKVQMDVTQLGVREEDVGGEIDLPSQLDIHVAGDVVKCGMEKMDESGQLEIGEGEGGSPLELQVSSQLEVKEGETNVHITEAAHGICNDKQEDDPSEVELKEAGLNIHGMNVALEDVAVEDPAKAQQSEGSSATTNSNQFN